MIKLVQPNISEEAIQDVSEVLRSGMLVHGNNGIEFENLLSERTESQYSLVVSSGTAALHLALVAMDIGHGDVVLLPGFSFIATRNVVLSVGATPLFVDVCLDNYNLHPENLRTAINEFQGVGNLKAIIAVWEFGSMAYADEIKNIALEYGLLFIEDAACAFGSFSNKGVMAGSIGDIGCFSFHPRKNVTCGEGGAITTNSKVLYEKIKSLRSHGVNMSDGCRTFGYGFNYRLTDFQSVLGIYGLKEFDKALLRRSEIAYKYQCLLHPLVLSGDIRLPTIFNGHSLQSYMLVITSDRKPNRNEFIEFLSRNEVESTVGAQLLSESTQLKNSRELAENGVVIPLHHLLSDENVDYIVLIIREYFQG